MGQAVDIIRFVNSAVTGAADEHSTVYVERQLPGRFFPGDVLAQADLDEVTAPLRAVKRALTGKGRPPEK